MGDLPAKSFESEKEVLAGLWGLLLDIADEIEPLREDLAEADDAA